MSNSAKAVKLYFECDNSDPKVSVLTPFEYEGFRDKNMYYSLVTGMLINKYASNEFEDDWIPFDRETFYIRKDDKEGWTDLKKTVYRLEKKGFIETIIKDNKNYIRLSNDDLFNADIYKRDRR